MADYVYNFDEMRRVAGQINDIGTRYASAASAFEEDMAGAMTGWEGPTRDAMHRFITGPVMEYTRDTVPKLLQALSELLEANATQMENADTEIGSNIPTSLGG